MTGPTPMTATEPVSEGRTPVVWMYERGGPWPARYYHAERTTAYLEPVDHGFGVSEGEWIETPLFAHPPATASTGEPDYSGTLDPLTALEDLLASMKFGTSHTDGSFERAEAAVAKARSTGAA